MTVIHIFSRGAPDSPEGERPAGRVAQKRATRREELLERAAALVAAEGLDRLTLQRLGSAMGLVPAALYRYFASKDELVAALQRRAVGTTHAAYVTRRTAVGPALRQLPSELAPLAEIFVAAQFYLALPETNPDEWQLVATLLGDPRPLVSEDEAHKTAPMLAALLGEVRARVEEAAARGAVTPGDATLRTMALWAALHGALSLAKARRITRDLPEPSVVGLDAVRAMVRGWGASADALRRAERAASTSSRVASKQDGRGT